VEASRRIELLYTDLQSLRFPKEIKAVNRKKYQDKARTSCGLDTAANSDRAKKNPGALAGATEALFKGEAAKLQKQDTPKADTLATSFFWDRASNSVQPMAELGGAV